MPAEGTSTKCRSCGTVNDLRVADRNLSQQHDETAKKAGAISGCQRRGAASTFLRAALQWSGQRQDADPHATLKRNLNASTQGGLSEARQRCLETA